MTRFLFAVAVAGLFAAGTTAQTPATPPVTSGTVISGPVTTGPAVIGTTALPAGDVITTTSSTGTRRGLFGRLRSNRNSGAVMTAPSLNTVPLMSTSPVIAGSGLGSVPAITPRALTPGTGVPHPMPPIAPSPRGGTSMIVPGSMPAVTGSGIVVAGGTTGGTVVPAGGVIDSNVVTTTGTVMPAGGVTTTNGMVMPAGSVVMLGSTMTMPSGTTMTPVMVTSANGTQRMGLIARIRARR